MGVAVGWLLAPGAHASDCGYPGSPAQSLAASAAVFLGTVLDAGQHGEDHRLRVERTFKGSLPEEVVVPGAQRAGYPGFRNGRRYLVYAQGVDGRVVSVSSCSRTAPTDDTALEQRMLLILAAGGSEAKAFENLPAALLQGPNDAERAEAARLLGIDAPAPFARDCVPSLVRALTDPAPRVRAAALGSMRRLGQRWIDDQAVIEPMRTEVVDATLGLLGDANGDVRKEAVLTADALGLQIPAVAPALEQALGREAARPDGREDVRRALSAALSARRLPGKQGAVLRQLLADLAHPDWVVRNGAAQSLGRLGARDAMAPLSKALRDGSAFVRASAAEALGAIGSPEAVPALVEALADPEAGVLEKAAVAVRDLGARQTARDRAVPRLADVLDGSNYLDRTAALRALAELGPDALAAVPALLRALRGTKPEDTYVRSGAADALGRLGPRARAAVPSLLAALHDPQPEVRRAAAEALASIDDRSDAVTRALITSSRDADESVRLQAMNALRRLGTADALRILEQEAVPSLIPRLSDADREARRAAAWRLVGLGESARPATDALIRRLDDPDEWVRSFAAQALANLGPAARPAVERLDGLLRSPRTRLAATVTLGRIGPGAEAALPSLLELLIDGDEAVRHAAAEALVRIGTPPAQAAYDRYAAREVPRLLKALRAGGREQRGEAARHLSHFIATAAEAVEPLTTALGDDYWLVRCKAAEALGTLGAQAGAAVPRLAQALDDPHLYARSAAREALKRIGTPEARAALDR